jgi:hypothetical protein
MSKAKAKADSGVTPGSELAVGALEGYAIANFDPTELREIVASNLSGGVPTEFDFPRLKVPNTGAPGKWTVETLDGEEQVPAIEGVIVGWTERRNRWEKSYDETGGGEPPVCTSPDGLVGYGNPGGDCTACTFAKFGSKGEKPLCRQSRALAMLQRDAILPAIVQVPATSLRPVRAYFMQLTTRGARFFDVITRLELTKGPKSWIIKPVAAGKLGDGDKPRVRPIVTQMEEVLRKMQIAPAEEG